MWRWRQTTWCIVEITHLVITWPHRLGLAFSSILKGLERHTIGKASQEQDGSGENKDEDGNSDASETSRRRTMCMSVQVIPSRAFKVTLAVVTSKPTAMLLLKSIRRYQDQTIINPSRITSHWLIRACLQRQEWSLWRQCGDSDYLAE